MKHEVQAQVLAFPCVAVYASYDAEAPDTAPIALCATQELADEVAVELNKNPRAVLAVVVDGFEHCKRFKTAKAFTDNKLNIVCTLAEAIDLAEIDEDHEE